MGRIMRFLGYWGRTMPLLRFRVESRFTNDQGKATPRSLDPREGEIRRPFKLFFYPSLPKWPRGSRIASRLRSRTSMANIAAAFEHYSTPHSALPALQKAVFMNAHHAGHFNPTVELVKLMVAAGVEVHYYATRDLAGVITAAGAIFHNYSSDEWSLKECALAGCARLKCEPSEEMKAELLFHQAIVATVEVLPFVIDELKKLQPDVVVSDSGYPWGHIAAQHLGIPSVSSCSSKMMPAEEKEALFSYLRKLDYNIKGQEVLLEEYGIEYDPADSYLNYSGKGIQVPLPV